MTFNPDEYLKSIKEEPFNPDEYLKSLTPSLVTQEAGAIPEPSAFVPRKEDIPAIAGATIGGIMMASRRYPAAMAVAGLGGVLGEGLEVARELIQKEPEAPKTFLEGAKRVGLAGVEGALGEGIGRGVGAIGKKIFSPFSKSTTPEIAEQVLKAQSIGVEPTLRMQTESPFLQSMQRKAETGFFGSKVTEAEKKALDQFENYAKKVTEDITTDTNPLTISDDVSKRLETFQESFYKAKDAIYDSFIPLVKDLPPDTQYTTRTLEDIIKRRSGEFSPAQLTELKTTLSNIVGKDVESKLVDASGKPIMTRLPSSLQSVDKLKISRTNLGSRLKSGEFGRTGIQSDIAELYGAMSKDLDNTYMRAGEGVADQIKKANDFYKQGIGKLKDRFLKAFIKTAPENLYKVAISEKSPTRIRFAKEVLGEDLFKEIKSQWFDDLINRSTNKVEGIETISPNLLSNNIRKSEKILSALFEGDSQTLAQINALRDVGNMFQRGQKIIGGSQTAFLSNILPMVGAIKSLLTAPLVTGEIGKKYLTTGFPKLERFAQLGITRATSPIAQETGRITERTFKDWLNQRRGNK